MKIIGTGIGLAAALLVTLVPAAAQDVTYPTRPAERGFVVDEVKLLKASDERKIWEISDSLLTDKKVPIIVVTIHGLASKNASSRSIEGYAQDLFDEWAIGFQDWNNGILLLVSVADRKARIELGADWGREKDGVCREIMDGWIIPNFKKGQFSEGILAGVEALDKMARELDVPQPRTPAWVYLMWAGFIGLGIFTFVSLIRCGASGWAWLFWGTTFSVTGLILVSLAKSSGGGGSSWSGGSFGGGFSGGGGATGSW